MWMNRKESINLFSDVTNWRSHQVEACCRDKKITDRLIGFLSFKHSRLVLLPSCEIATIIKLSNSWIAKSYYNGKLISLGCFELVTKALFYCQLKRPTSTRTPSIWRHRHRRRRRQSGTSSTTTWRRWRSWMRRRVPGFSSTSVIWKQGTTTPNISVSSQYPNVSTGKRLFSKDV